MNPKNLLLVYHLIQQTPDHAWYDTMTWLKSLGFTSKQIHDALVELATEVERIPLVKGISDCDGG
ncbi:MAG: hypothetical protein GY788_21175 [bacterium]|nr:hypothetical protein [bacterium]